MPSAVRDGDETTGACDKGLPCCPHGRTGTVNVTSGNVFVNGKGLHRLNDTGTTNCPHGGVFASVAGSAMVFCNGRSVIRIGDATICQSCGQQGSHTTGSRNVFVGG